MYSISIFKKKYLGGIVSIILMNNSFYEGSFQSSVFAFTLFGFLIRMCCVLVVISMILEWWSYSDSFFFWFVPNLKMIFEFLSRLCGWPCTFLSHENVLCIEHWPVMTLGCLQLSFSFGTCTINCLAVSHGNDSAWSIFAMPFNKHIHHTLYFPLGFYVFGALFVLLSQSTVEFLMDEFKGCVQ